MAIEIITKSTGRINKNNKIKEQEACERLYEDPQGLKIFNVSPIRPSKRNDRQFYCFVDFKMDDGTTFGISYSFYFKNGKFTCGASSKLYNLMSGFMDLNPLTTKALSFDDVKDIEEVLLGKEFYPSIKIENIGSNSYPYIICEMIIWIEQ